MPRINTDFFYPCHPRNPWLNNLRSVTGCSTSDSRLAKGPPQGYVCGMTWSEICEDKLLATLPYRIESDRWGNVVMSPPPRSRHAEYQTEISVEVVSSSNIQAQLEERKRLFFQAGAQEVWLCSLDGDMTFLGPAGRIPESRFCPGFPKRILLDG